MRILQLIQLNFENGWGEIILKTLEVLKQPNKQYQHIICNGQKLYCKEKDMNRIG